MKTKELKNILDRLPDDAEIKVMLRAGRGHYQCSIKEARAEIVLNPSLGDDFNKAEGRVYLYIK